MSSELLTTREAAAMLGVGPSSVKRWADAGVLPCAKTPGGHRRYPREAVRALLGEVRETPSEPVSAEAWVERLAFGVATDDVVRALERARERLGAWHRVVDSLGPVVSEIGRRWAWGEISVLQEHLASERLARGLARIAESIEVPTDAPHALLMTAPGDDHTLGLSMAEVAIREAGWLPRWAGRRTPVEGVEQFVARGQTKLLAVSASQGSEDATALATLERRLGRVCRDHGCLLVLGGRGRWPTEPSFGVRLHDFEALSDHLSSG